MLCVGALCSGAPRLPSSLDAGLRRHDNHLSLRYSQVPRNLHYMTVTYVADLICYLSTRFVQIGVFPPVDGWATRRDVCHHTNVVKASLRESHPRGGAPLSEVFRYIPPVDGWATRRDMMRQTSAAHQDVPVNPRQSRGVSNRLQLQQ